MTAPDDFLSRLRDRYDKMRPSERKLADLVLANPAAAVEMTMDEIARRVGVSSPTVARFCAAVGCGGFREFKLRLAQDQGPGHRFVHPDVDANDAPDVVTRKIADGAVAALIDLGNAINPMQVSAAVDILAEAARIEFYGSGNSGIVAQDIQHKFFRLGMPTVAYADPHVFCMSALTLGPEDVVVVISNSGRTNDILEAARDASLMGARVIAVTRGDSPLAKIASLTINVATSEDSEVYSPMSSRLAHLVIGDMLTVSVAQRKGAFAALRMHRSKQAVRRRRASVK